MPKISQKDNYSRRQGVRADLSTVP